VQTGLVESRQGRHREANLKDAKAALLALLRLQQAEAAHGVQADMKRAQVGSGMRADKTVTIRFQDNRATHHSTGKSMPADRYMKGEMDTLWI
jgi:peptide chain release factor 1